MLKSNLSLLLSVFALLVMTACGGGPSVSIAKSSGGGSVGTGAGGGVSVSSYSEEYSYSFDINGCKTGSQVADSLAGYCRNLANDALNHYCADLIRFKSFKQNCKYSGVTWSAEVPTEESGE